MRTCYGGSYARAIHSSPTCRPWPLPATRWQAGWAAILAMVAPMLMHTYTDATAAGQTLIATQFATVLQVLWRAIWQFLDAIPLAA